MRRLRKLNSVLYRHLNLQLIRDSFLTSQGIPLAHFVPRQALQDLRASFRGSASGKAWMQEHFSPILTRLQSYREQGSALEEAKDRTKRDFAPLTEQLIALVGTSPIEPASVAAVSILVDFIDDVAGCADLRQQTFMHFVSLLQSKSPAATKLSLSAMAIADFERNLALKVDSTLQQLFSNDIRYQAGGFVAAVEKLGLSAPGRSRPKKDIS